MFDLAIARTGLNDDDARRAGFDPFTFESTAYDHKAYYQGAHLSWDALQLAARGWEAVCRAA
jgi:hypothetical protein